MAIRTWTCPSCDRRVPENVAICRCGASRSEAQANEALRQVGRGPGRTVRSEPMPTEVKVWFVVIALALVGGLVFAARSEGPPPVAPLLGWTDQPPPSPTPYRPSPRPR